MNNQSAETTELIEAQNHPLKVEIDLLRNTILASDDRLQENIKWNSPNYSVGTEDRITMRIQPPSKIQLIFHRGSKKRVQPDEKIIQSTSTLLSWKENDRAVITFNSMEAIRQGEGELIEIVKEWILKTI